MFLYGSFGIVVVWALFTCAEARVRVWHSFRRFVLSVVFDVAAMCIFFFLWFYFVGFICLCLFLVFCSSYLVYC